MATQLKISGPAAALLALAALLAAGARADEVGTEECRARGKRGRIRLYPIDSDATTLHMHDCGLTQIDPDAFTGLSNLQNIYLYNNVIENINPAVFHTVPTLTRLWLYKNKLRELPVFDERSCTNLTELLLYSNKLTVIDNGGTFMACTKLQILDLGYNSIEFIHRNVFSALTDLRRLHLGGNKIRLIPNQMFANNGKLELLDLQINLITQLPPEFASSLQRAGASLNSFRFHNNPALHCACLLELLADVQRAGVNNYKRWDGITHYQGTQPECNFIGIYQCRRHAPSGLLRLPPHSARDLFSWEAIARYLAFFDYAPKLGTVDP